MHEKPVGFLSQVEAICLLLAAALVCWAMPFLLFAPMQMSSDSPLDHASTYEGKVSKAYAH